jgi:integrase
MASAGGFPVARRPKPWFWENRNAYFVTVRGKRHNLGPDKAEAERQFHALMAEEPKRPSPRIATGLTAAELFDKYLDWCAQHRKPRTYDWYKDHLQDFLAALPAPRMSAAELRPFHVVEWSDKHTTWGDCQRRGAIIAVQRPYNWAVKLGYIESNPIAYIEKPRARRRESNVTPAEWATICDSFPEGDPFRDLLEFCWQTGCRPQEAKAIEARHVTADRRSRQLPYGFRSARRAARSGAGRPRRRSGVV